MAKKNNTIFWIIGIAILLIIILPKLQLPKEIGMIGLTPHYYKDGIEVFPQKGFLGFTIVTPPGGSYDQIAFAISATNTGNTPISNMQIVDASPTEFLIALSPATTQTLAIGESKTLWTSSQMDTIQFEAISPINFWIEVSGEYAPGEGESNYLENFETGGLVNWNQGIGDDFDWTVHSGSTSSVNTGPGSAYEGSYYIYTESSSPNYPSKTSILESNEFNIGSTSAITFHYHMYGTSMGTLYLEVATAPYSSWTTIWSETGDLGNIWNDKTLSLNSYNGQTIKLRFKGITGSSYTSDMALDGINVFNLEVEGEPQLIQYEETSSGDITFEPECISNDYYSCYSNDVYWYDSCDVREDKKEECGSSAYTGVNHCYLDHVYRDYVTRGCSGSSCTESTSKIKQEDCGTFGCLDGVCLTCISHDYYSCYSNDVYWYDSCGIREDKKEECGASGYTGVNYCYDNDVYRDYVTRGCSGLSCTSSTSGIKQYECGTLGCSGGVCNPEPPWIYTGVSYSISDQDTSPRGIFRYGSYWYMLGSATERVYKYTSSWSYISRYSISSQDADPEGICNRAGYWYMLGEENNRVYKYDSNWNYVSRTDVSDETAYTEDIFWDGSYFWILSSMHGSYSYVYKYDYNMNYLGISFTITEIGSSPGGFFFDGTYWWIVSGGYVYKYSPPYWTYTGERYYVGTQDSVTRDIFHDGNNWWMIGASGDRVYKYTG